MTDKLPMPITDEQIDAAYRDVWSTVPHAQRLSAFARKIAAEAVRLERERCIAAIKDVPIDHAFVNTIEACAAAIRARSEL